MKLNVNLTDVEVKEGFDVVPSGVYDLRVIKGEEKAGPKGPYLNWELEVVNDPEWDKTKIFHITSLSKKALQMPSGLAAMWLALGLPLEEVDSIDAIGLTLVADVGQEIYKKPQPDGSFVDIPKNTVDRFHYDA